MWWGTAIEAPDPSAGARYYFELLGRPIGHDEPGTAILAANQGPISLVFQQADGYQAPEWAPVDGRQRPMMQFDFQVGDLSACCSTPPAIPSASASTRTERTTAR